MRCLLLARRSSQSRRDKRASPLTRTSSYTGYSSPGTGSLISQNTQLTGLIPATKFLLQVLRDAFEDKFYENAEESYLRKFSMNKLCLIVTMKTQFPNSNSSVLRTVSKKIELTNNLRIS